MLPKGAAFVGYSLIFRSISALGATTCDTAALSFVTQEFPDAVGLSIVSKNMMCKSARFDLLRLAVQARESERLLRVRLCVLCRLVL